MYCAVLRLAKAQEQIMPYIRVRVEIERSPRDKPGSRQRQRTRKYLSNARIVNSPNARCNSQFLQPDSRRAELEFQAANAVPIPEQVFGRRGEREGFAQLLGCPTGGRSFHDIKCSIFRRWCDSRADPARPFCEFLTRPCAALMHDEIFDRGRAGVGFLAGWSWLMVSRRWTPRRRFAREHSLRGSDT